MSKVLFICVENSRRSQMAKALFNKYAKNTMAESAGNNPAKKIDSKTIKAMKEKGISLAGKKPKRFNFLSEKDFSVMITMGCRNVCPIISKKKTLEWDIEDPKGKSIEKYRKIRDAIEVKVLELIKELEIQE